MKILVTGYKGYVGSHLMKLLPDNTVGIDIKDGQDILSCDLPEADIVIHLAAQAGVTQSMANPSQTVKVNILGTLRLLEKYQDAKFIFASTGGAIQDKIISPYGLTKYCTEEFIKMLHKNYVILRFANVYGKEGSRSVIDKFLKDERLTIFGDGLQNRTFVYIDDLLRGIIMSIKWPVGSYYFGSDQNYTIMDLARATKKPYDIVPAREGELLQSSLKNTTPDWEPSMNVIDYIKNNI